MYVCVCMYYPCFFLAHIHGILHNMDLRESATITKILFKEMMTNELKMHRLELTSSERGTHPFLLPYGGGSLRPIGAVS